MYVLCCHMIEYHSFFLFLQACGGYFDEDQLCRMLASARDWANNHPKQKQERGPLATAMHSLAKSMGRSTAAGKVRHNIRFMRTSLASESATSIADVDLAVLMKPEPRLWLCRRAPRRPNRSLPRRWLT